ncbi:MAG: hypothetical protein ACYST6_17275 [Planctomycetota bacterium]
MTPTDKEIIYFTVNRHSLYLQSCPSLYSIGNLVGSNIFNTLLVTGTAGVVRPFELVQRLETTDYWIMISITAGFAILSIAGRKKITRTGVILLLCSYIAYMARLFSHKQRNKNKPRGFWRGLFCYL